MQKQQKKLIRNALIFGIVAILISSCSGTRKQLEANIAPIKQPDIVLPEAEILRLDNITWKVITKENSDQTFIEMQEQGEYPVVFAISPEDYKKLSNNLVDIRSHMQQKNSIQNSYERYYKRSSEIIEETNSKIEKMLLELKNKYSSS